MDIGKNFTENELRERIGRVVIIAPGEAWKVVNMVEHAPRLGVIVKGLIFYQTGIDMRTNSKLGHWCCLAVRGNDVYFYDSLGIFPDDELNRIPISFRMRTNQNERLLGSILYQLKKKGFRIHYNDIKMQEDKDGVNTCGRYCALFLKVVESEGNPYINMTNI